MRFVQKFYRSLKVECGNLPNKTKKYKEVNPL